MAHMGFPIIRGAFWVAPRRRIIVYWGLYWGPLILGSYHLGVSQHVPYI